MATNLDVVVAADLADLEEGRRVGNALVAENLPLTRLDIIYGRCVKAGYELTEEAHPWGS